MRYVLVLAGVFFLIWRFRAARAEHISTKAQAKHTQTQGAVTDMVACQQCGMHIPAHEALVGSQGSYCSVAHRHSQEG